MWCPHIINKTLLIFSSFIIIESLENVRIFTIISKIINGRSFGPSMTAERARADIIQPHLLLKVLRKLLVRTNDDVLSEINLRLRTSALLVWAWKNTASRWLHFGQGCCSVLGSVGSEITSATMWVNSLGAEKDHVIRKRVTLMIGDPTITLIKIGSYSISCIILFT